jgi:hypothetical protein
MIISLIIAVVVIALFPFVVRWVFALIGFAAVLFIVVAARAQPTQTRCYDAGPTKVCETKDQNGAVISQSRCYKSGKDLHCDTQNFQPVPRQ